MNNDIDTTTSYSSAADEQHAVTTATKDTNHDVISVQPTSTMKAKITISGQKRPRHDDDIDDIPVAVDDSSIQQQQQQPSQQLTNLESWMKLLQTAIQPFEQPPLPPPQSSYHDHDNSDGTDKNTQFHHQRRRSDGRTLLTEMRPYTIQYGILSSSSDTAVVGSCMVCTTTTTATTTNHDSTTTTTTSSSIVVGTVTLQIGQPSMMAPNQGDLIVTIVNHSNSTGSNNNNNSNHSLLSVQSFIQHILEENIPLEQLGIETGKLAYRLMVTVTILFTESSSNVTALSDVCLMAAVAALLDTKLPSQLLLHPPVSSGSGSSADDGVLRVSTTTTPPTTTLIGTLPTLQKSLYMPIIPIAFTAIAVRSTSCDGSSSTTRSTDPRPSNESFEWIIDPTIHEQHQQMLLSAEELSIQQQQMVTIVMNGTPTNDDAELLCLQLSPPTTSTATATATKTAISFQDLDDLISTCHGHAKSFFTKFYATKTGTTSQQ